MAHPGNGFRRPCLRTLDDPIQILGLEPEDWLLLMVTGAGMFVVNGIVAVAVIIVGFVTLRAIKRGKPSGYLFYLLYRSGFTRLLPRSLRPPHLLALAWPWQRCLEVKFSPMLHEAVQPDYWPQEIFIASPEEEEGERIVVERRPSSRIQGRM